MKKGNKLEKVLLIGGAVASSVIPKIVDAQENPKYGLWGEEQFENIPLDIKTRNQKVKNIEVVNTEKEQTSIFSEEVKPIINILEPDSKSFRFNSKEDLIDSINNFGKIKYFSANEEGNVVGLVSTENDTDKLYLANFYTHILKEISLDFNYEYDSFKSEPHIIDIEGIALSKDGEDLAIITNQEGGMIMNFVTGENFMKIYKFKDKKFRNPSISNMVYYVPKEEKDLDNPERVDLVFPVITVLSGGKPYAMSIFDEKLYDIGNGEKCVDLGILGDGYKIYYLTESSRGDRKFNVLNYFDATNMKREFRESMSLDDFFINESDLSEDGNTALITTHKFNPFNAKGITRSNNVLEVKLNNYEKGKIVPVASNLTEQEIYSMQDMDSNVKYSFYYNPQASNDGISAYVELEYINGKKTHYLTVQKGEDKMRVYSSSMPIEFELSDDGKVVNGKTGNFFFNERTFSVKRE